MHTTLAFTLAVAITGWQAGGAPESIPAPPGYAPPVNANSAHAAQLRAHPSMQVPGFAYPSAHQYPDVTPQGLFGPKRCEGWVYPNGVCGHHCVKDPYSWKNWWFPPGNMVLHYPYFPAEHGYYYFEPYNVTRLAIQQAFVAHTGGDPRHPYDNRTFDDVYETYNERHPEGVDYRDDLDYDGDLGVDGADTGADLPPVPPNGDAGPQP